MVKLTTKSIREQFANLYQAQRFTQINREASMTNLVGNSTLEIIGASFIANEESIFGEVNQEYVAREEGWYNSMSLNVNDIPGGAPQIWKAVADKDGFINSNYGWCIYSAENLLREMPSGYMSGSFDEKSLPSQYSCVKAELLKNPESRRAIMIYTRPQMWLDYNKNGRSDFMCTNAVQYLIRDGALDAVVQMRSNDAIFGYKNDFAWQKHVLEKLATDLGVPAGNIHWQVGSLHIYARHYYLVDHFSKTGQLNISKAEYDATYGTQP